VLAYCCSTPPTVYCSSTHSTPRTLATTGGSCLAAAWTTERTWSTPRAARREVAEESGIILPDLGHKLWVRESRFHYKGRDHHRIEHVFLSRTPSTTPQAPLKPTENEKTGLIERRWWSATELRHCQDDLLPDNLAELLDDLLTGCLNGTPLTLIS